MDARNRLKANMQIGDVVVRIIRGPISLQLEEESGKYGIIISLRQSDYEDRSVIAKVYWPDAQQVYSISTDFLEVICTCEKEK